MHQTEISSSMEEHELACVWGMGFGIKWKTRRKHHQQCCCWALVMNTGSSMVERDPLSFPLSILSGKIALIVNRGIGIAKSGLSNTTKIAVHLSMSEVSGTLLKVNCAVKSWVSF